jgi:hypothetical protein
MKKIIIHNCSSPSFPTNFHENCFQKAVKNSPPSLNDSIVARVSIKAKTILLANNNRKEEQKPSPKK